MANDSTDATVFPHGARVRFVAPDSHHAGCVGFVAHTWRDDAGGEDICLVRVPGVAQLVRATADRLAAAPAPPAPTQAKIEGL